MFTWTYSGPPIPNLSLMWTAKPKELPTPVLRACSLALYFFGDKKLTHKMLVKLASGFCQLH